MKTYEVVVDERNTIIYLVNAPDEETARNIGRRRYENGEATDVSVNSSIDSLEATEVITPAIKRTAIVTGGARDSKQVKAFMPSNYLVRVREGVIFIEGEDVAGWTLDDYVIPRLASGGIRAVEVEVQR